MSSALLRSFDTMTVFSLISFRTGTPLLTDTLWSPILMCFFSCAPMDLASIFSVQNEHGTFFDICFSLSVVLDSYLVWSGFCFLNCWTPVPACVFADRKSVV